MCTYREYTCVHIEGIHVYRRYTCVHDTCFLKDDTSSLIGPMG